MNALYQRLKELSRSDFESLVDQLLQARYPAANIFRVDGSGGDEGVDSFSGTLHGDITIWQAKHFANGIAKVQQKQILKSIAVAFEKHRPSRWTLCVPIDLKTHERKWFDDKIAVPYSANAKIELIQASNIIFQLLHDRNIREAFFPDAVTDTLALRELAINADRISPLAKRSLGGEYFDQYIQSLETVDPRFRFEIVTGSTRNSCSNNDKPGLLASVFDGKSRVDVFARDVAALQDDPIKLIVAFSREAAEKARGVFKTGREEIFSGEEIARFQLPSIIKNLMGEPARIDELTLTPSSITTRELPTRVEISYDGRTRIFPFVPFAIKHLGTEEVTFASKSGLPFSLEIRASLLDDNDCELTLCSSSACKKISEIKDGIDLVDAIASGAELLITNIATQKVFIKFTSSKEVPAGSDNDDMRNLVDDAILVSEYLGYDLRMPLEPPTQADYDLLHTLKHMATGKDFKVNGGEFSLTKDESIPGQLEHLLGLKENTAMIFEPNRSEQINVLFGDPINTGSMILEMDQLRLKNPEEAVSRYTHAKNGETIDISFIGPTTARYRSKSN